MIRIFAIVALSVFQSLPEIWENGKNCEEDWSARTSLERELLIFAQRPFAEAAVGLQAWDRYLTVGTS
jgi:hypothetical protein